MTKPLSLDQVVRYASQLILPKKDSRKGDNGKLLIIGGSSLFHAASRWSLEVASRLVDMVFYSSVPENNQLIQQAKLEFWDGIVIERDQLEPYLSEADCILIGPGMQRVALDLKLHSQPANYYQSLELSNNDWQQHTQKIINYLLAKYPQKKWVIDAGALQMVNPLLLTESCIITPHQHEMQVLQKNASLNNSQNCLEIPTILLKGEIDQITHQQQQFLVEGGNPGMTKGGTGDVLAGLVAGLYTNNSILPSSVIASFVNKKAGDNLYKKIGPFFNATDLASQIPFALWQLMETSLN